MDNIKNTMNESVKTVEKRKYTRTEKFMGSLENRIKFSKYETTNKVFEQFSNSGEVKKSSLIQYKSAITRFEEFINKNFIIGTIEDIEAFANAQKNVNTGDNVKNYVKSFMRYWIKTNGVNLVSKELLLYLVFDNRCKMDYELVKENLL